MRALILHICAPNNLHNSAAAVFVRLIRNFCFYFSYPIQIQKQTNKREHTLSLPQVSTEQPPTATPPNQSKNGNGHQQQCQGQETHHQGAHQPRQHMTSANANANAGSDIDPAEAEHMPSINPNPNQIRLDLNSLLWLWWRGLPRNRRDRITDWAWIISIFGAIFLWLVYRFRMNGLAFAAGCAIYYLAASASKWLLHRFGDFIEEEEDRWNRNRSDRLINFWTFVICCCIVEFCYYSPNNIYEEGLAFAGGCATILAMSESKRIFIGYWNEPENRGPILKWGFIICYVIGGVSLWSALHPY